MIRAQDGRIHALKSASAANITSAAEQAISGAKPLPMTGYKLDLMKGVVRDLLEKLAT